MSRILTDAEIEALVAERKPLPANWRARLEVKQKSNQAYSQRELPVNGEAGNQFRIVLQKNNLIPLDFSLVLKFVDADKNEYILVRFNGKHPSQHTNKWEKSRRLPNPTFRNRFHLHRATERYQTAGLDIDGFAEATDNYNSYPSALEKFSEYVNLVPPDEGAMLWDEPEGKR
jgi:hypothetical protein